MKFFKLLPATLVLIGAGLSASAATLTQCPASNVAGSAYTGCNFLITENANGSYTTTVDATQPFFGGEDNYAGFQNNTNHTVSSLVINGNGTDIFGFDGDGPTPITATTPTGYEGPNNTFSNYSSGTIGTVNFTVPIAPGGSTYFYMEDAINPSMPPIGGTPEPATLYLLGMSFVGLGGYALQRKRARS